MHELGYCESVLQAVERRAAGRPVARLGVRVGSFHRIVPEAFEQSFQLVAAGGIADGATTEVSVVPAQVECRECGKHFTADSVPACQTCGSLDVEVHGGDELILEWIQYRNETGDIDLPDVDASEHTHDAPEAATQAAPEHAPEHSHAPGSTTTGGL